MNKKSITGKSRNTCFTIPSELFDKGDFPRIAKLANKHYSTVVQTLATGTRHNKEVIETAQKYYDAKRIFFASVGILKQAS